MLTDTDHKSGFKLQSMLLARMFQLVETNEITVPLFDPSQVPDPNMSNSVFLREYTANLLKSAFPHIQKFVPTVLFLSRRLSDHSPKRTNPSFRRWPARVPQRHQQVQACSSGFPHSTQGVLGGQRRALFGRKGGGSATEGAGRAGSRYAHSGHAQAFTTRRQGRGHLIKRTQVHCTRDINVSQSDVFYIHQSLVCFNVFLSPVGSSFFIVVIYPAIALFSSLTAYINVTLA